MSTGFNAELTPDMESLREAADHDPQLAILVEDYICAFQRRISLKRRINVYIKGQETAAEMEVQAAQSQLEAAQAKKRSLVSANQIVKAKMDDLQAIKEPEEEVKEEEAKDKGEEEDPVQVPHRMYPYTPASSSSAASKSAPSSHPSAGNTPGPSEYSFNSQQDSIQPPHTSESECSQSTKSKSSMRSISSMSTTTSSDDNYEGQGI